MLRRLKHPALSLAAAAVVAAGAGALAWLAVRSVRRRWSRPGARLTPPVRLVLRGGTAGGRSSLAPPEGRRAVHSPVVTGDAERQRDKARAHVQFGQLLFKSGRLSKAISHFETAIALNGRNARAHFELAEALQRIREPSRAAAHYERVLELKPTCVEAATNLAIAFLAAERPEDAVRMSRRAIELERARAAGVRSSSGASSSSSSRGAAAKAINSEAYYNLNAALRACGRAAEACEETWRAIEAAGGTRVAPLALGAAAASTRDGDAAGAASSSTASRMVGWLGRRAAPAPPALSVVCVKWGSKYGAHYVNKLRAAVRAHMAAELAFDFVCYTDDPVGLDAEVQTRPLDGMPGWDGWWLKAAIFGPAAISAGRVVYFDLDTIIIGPLDALLLCNAPFATLSAAEWACERDNAEGVNSSIMLWDASCASALAPIYTGLLDGLVFRHLLRFDHWLEMLLLAHRPRAHSAQADAPEPTGGGLESVQELFPGRVVEYTSGCAHGVPAGASVVCFPRSPKPHEVTDEWAQEAWHRL